MTDPSIRMNDSSMTPTPEHAASEHAASERYLDFSPIQADMSRLVNWWQALHGGPSEYPTPATTAARVELRRATTIADVMLSAGFQRLRAWLMAQGNCSIAESQLEALAVIVGLLAHIRENEPSAKSWAALMGDDADPAVSELRFKRILKSTDLEDLYGQLRRVVPLVGYRAPVGRIGQEIDRWFSERHNTPRRWALDYAWPTT